ncbi:MAG: polyprenyl synthetase family protein [Spirochaetia bacterium]
MSDWLALKKPLVARELGRQLERRRRDFSRVNVWGPDAAARIRAFAARGKMLRGSLLLLGYEMYASRAAATAAARAAAAALEIIHSSLLVHDDIMDNDRLRRGASTIFAQYEQVGRGRRAADPAHFGSAMGICAGDVGYFVAGDILSTLPLESEMKSDLLSLVFRELAWRRLRRRAAKTLAAWGAPGCHLPGPRRRPGDFRIRKGDRQARGVGHPRGQEDAPVPRAFPQGPRQGKSGLGSALRQADAEQG